MNSLPRSPGIYKITCLSNGKIYIGSSENLNRRWLNHKRLLKNNCHPNPHLQNAWNKYGESAFNFEIVEFTTIETMIDREQYWLDNLMPYDRITGFNIARNALSPLLGMPMSDATKAKLSAVNIGKTMPQNIRSRISQTLKGREFTEIHRERLSRSASKQFVVISPDGIETVITNLQGFCRENGLDQGNMMHVVSGRYRHCKGWKCHYA